MNEKNYGSREVCQRLMKAGIVLETDMYWSKSGGYLIKQEGWKSRDKIPAPSMTEVWRELPDEIDREGITYSLEMAKSGKMTEVWYENYSRDVIPEGEIENINPVDALIDLLIWVKKEGT